MQRDMDTTFDSSHDGTHRMLTHGERVSRNNDMLTVTMANGARISTKLNQTHPRFSNASSKTPLSTYNLVCYSDGRQIQQSDALSSTRFDNDRMNHDSMDDPQTLQSVQDFIDSLPMMVPPGVPITVVSQTSTTETVVRTNVDDDTLVSVSSVQTDEVQLDRLEQLSFVSASSSPLSSSPMRRKSHSLSPSVSPSSSSSSVHIEEIHSDSEHDTRAPKSGSSADSESSTHSKGSRSTRKKPLNRAAVKNGPIIGSNNNTKNKSVHKHAKKKTVKARLQYDNLDLELPDSQTTPSHSSLVSSSTSSSFLSKPCSASSSTSLLSTPSTPLSDSPISSSSLSSKCDSGSPRRLSPRSTRVALKPQRRGSSSLSSSSSASLSSCKQGVLLNSESVTLPKQSQRPNERNDQNSSSSGGVLRKRSCDENFSSSDGDNESNGSNSSNGTTASLAPNSLDWMTAEIDDRISNNSYFQHHQTNKNTSRSPATSVPKGIGGIVFEDDVGVLFDSDEEERYRPARFQSNCVLSKHADDPSRKRKASMTTWNDNVDSGFDFSHDSTHDTIGVMCDGQPDDGSECRGPEWSVKRRNCTPHTHVHLRPESVQLACAGRCLESRELVASMVESVFNQYIAKQQLYNEQYLANAVALLDRRFAEFASNNKS